ncbi:MAG: DUF1013 domain-containing protein [Pseudomonadota bacterium]
MNLPLMPMATAVWLVENTALTFDQIAEFCGLHPLEVQGIADETVGQNIVGQDPVRKGQITMAEIERCQNDPKARLKLEVDDVPAVKRTKGPRYTPVSKRQDRPDGISWLIRNHPELSDAQVCKLVGTTKPTIQAIRDKTHWNIANISPQDPVALGICTQLELDEAVKKAARRAGIEIVESEEAPIPEAVLAPIVDGDVEEETETVQSSAPEPIEDPWAKPAPTNDEPTAQTDPA